MALATSERPQTSPHHPAPLLPASPHHITHPKPFEQAADLLVDLAASEYPDLPDPLEREMVRESMDVVSKVRALDVVSKLGGRAVCEGAWAWCPSVVRASGFGGSTYMRRCYARMREQGCGAQRPCALGRVMHESYGRVTRERAWEH